MSKREKYFYTFTYVDGSTQEFEKDNNELSSKLLNPGRERIQVDNVVINLDNVIKVTVETKTQRDEERKDAEKNAKETYEALKNIKF